MSALRATALVTGRELRETTRRRSFWAVLAVLVAASTVAVLLPELIGDDGPRTYDVAVVDGNAELTAGIEGVGSVIDAEVSVRPVSGADPGRLLLDDDEVDAVLLAGENPEILVQGQPGELVAVLQQVVVATQLTERLGQVGISAAEAQDLLAAPGADLRTVDGGRDSRRGGAAILSIVLYVVLLMVMVQVSNGVALEKSNRISEVLLAIVRPGPLMFGKVLGIGMVAIASLLAMAVPVLVRVLAGGDLPDGLADALVGGWAWLLLGLALYLTVASALGALVERQEEAGSVVAPLSGVLLVGYLVAQSAPDSPLAAVLAYVPFTSPLVVPVRLAVGVTSTVEVVASLILGVLTVVVVGRLGAVIYRRAIVRTGRRLKLSDVLRPS